jgi:predicted translin family RNA/ssDNA-binding protein
MSKGKFGWGFAIGVLAGLAAKYLYDNQEAVAEVVGEKAGCVREEFNDFVDYASKKVSQINKNVSETASKYTDAAKDQLQEFKEAFKAGINEEDESEDE